MHGFICDSIEGAGFKNLKWQPWREDSTRENVKPCGLELHHQNVISERILTKYRTMLQVCYFFTVYRSYISHCVSKYVMSFCLLNDYWLIDWLIENEAGQSQPRFFYTANNNSVTLCMCTMNIGRGQWCSGARTHRNAVPANILGPERRSGSYPSSQAEHYCCSVQANVCRQDQICLFWN